VPLRVVRRVRPGSYVLTTRVADRRGRSIGARENVVIR
jgi:hypothetical protein